ncbi:MAG: enoyl-CoA hydratase-related protein [Deltaproteobacteria bacterium]|nr:enoyl-CoA hydratase-related protein [Deltaproteobacteria bacterium]
MGNEAILVKVEDHVGTITLNRPEAMNYLDPVMSKEIENALADFERDEEIRALIITGAGRAFCAGGDIKTMQQKKAPHEWIARLEGTTGCIRAMVNCPKPIIASVNGPAVGAGCNLALAADLILASEKAVFGEVFTRIGLIPDCGGFFLLPRRVGLTKAKELIFTGKTINAQEAAQMGMVNRVVSAEALGEETRKLAEELAGGATLAIGMAKRLLNLSFQSDLEAILNAELTSQTMLRYTEDHPEGVQAFREKRKPNFKGK